MTEAHPTPPPGATPPSRLKLIVALAVAGALVALALVWLGGGGPEAGQAGVAGPAAATATSADAEATGDWRRRWDAAGLPADAARHPDAAGKDLRGLGLRDAAAIAAQLAAWQRTGVLVPLDPRRPRRQPVRDGEALAAALVAAGGGGRDRPVAGGDSGVGGAAAAAPASVVEAQPVEVAMWIVAVAHAAGLPTSAQRLAVAVETPLLASRNAYGVEVGGTLVPAFAGRGAATPISDAALVADWLVQRAHAARTAGRYPDAHRDLALASQLQPGLPAATFARGVLQIEQGLVDRGVETCEQALRAAEDPLARLMLADVLAANDKPFKAFEMVEAALARHPDLPEAHVARGLLRAGRVATAPTSERDALVAAARESFERALAIDPAAPGAVAGLAQLELATGHDDAALARLAAAATATDDPEAGAMLAQLYLQRGDHAAALAGLQLRRRPDDERWWTLLVQAQAMAGDTAAAAASAAEAASRLPASRRIAMLRAQLLRREGKLAEAIAALAPLQQAEGEEGAQAAAMQAELQLAAGDVDAALASLQRALRLDPRHKEASLLLLVAYARAGKAKERDAHAAALVGRGEASHEELSTLLLEAGDADSARALAEGALPTLPPQGEQVRRLGVLLAMIHVASGRKAEAIALRDRLAVAAGGADSPAGKQLIAEVDKAIAGAEAELQQMDKEADAEAPAAAAGAEAP